MKAKHSTVQLIQTIRCFLLLDVVGRISEIIDNDLLYDHHENTEGNYYEECSPCWVLYNVFLQAG